MRAALLPAIAFALVAFGGAAPAMAQGSGAADALQIAPPPPPQGQPDIKEVRSDATAAQVGAQQVDNDAAPPEEVNHEGRTAQAPTPISTVKQGRDTAVAAVGGRDRCDPTRTGGEKAQGCDRILERRADEFSRPEASAVSPEARLLLLNTTTPPADADQAARAGTPGAFSDQLAAEAIAASTNQPPPTTPGVAAPVPGGSPILTPSPH